MSEWDYIVIGAGSSGCAAAHELVKAGKQVLVLEAGGSDRSPYIKFYPGMLFAGNRFDWEYRCEPDPSRNGASEAWPRGRVLGGSSSINGTIFVRGATTDYDRWSELCEGRGGWSAREVMPLFRELECSDQNNSHRGKSGPLHVRTKRLLHPTTEAFIESAVAAGYPYNEDYNGPSQEGVSYIQFTQRKGWRWSSADAFIRPHLGRQNLKLILHALVEKIEIADGRAVGVTFRHEGQSHRARARDVILSAGALNSPQILMLSGIGDPEELERHRIDVVHSLPGVGRNLREHPYLRFTYHARIPTYNPTEGFLQKLAIGAKFLMHREGPLSGAFESVAFLKSSPAEPVPDVQIHFAPTAYLGKFGDPRALAPYRAFSIMVNKNHSVSCGQIRLRSRDPGDPPVIDGRLLEHRADLDTMKRCFDLVRKIASTQPIAGLIEAETVPGPAIMGGEALEKYVRDNTEPTFHPVGTCRMGVDAGAVVSADLAVRGIGNLWIADASVMPDLVSGNTNAACMMIGMKLGRYLCERRN